MWFLCWHVWYHVERGLSSPGATNHGDSQIFKQIFVFFSSYFTNWWLTDIQTSTRSTSMHRPPYEGRYIAHFNNQAFWIILNLKMIPLKKSNLMLCMLCTKIIFNSSAFYCNWLKFAKNNLRRIVFLMIFAIEACHKYWKLRNIIKLGSHQFVVEFVCMNKCMCMCHFQTYLHSTGFCYLFIWGRKFENRYTRAINGFVYTIERVKLCARNAANSSSPNFYCLWRIIVSHNRQKA